MLLQLLRIKNLALVEDLEWEIAPGFTAITGETGAGKSIIIGALQLLLGERADKSLLRTGAETCTVEAIFQGDDCAKWNGRFEESGIEPCDGDLILKRSLRFRGPIVNSSTARPLHWRISKNLVTTWLICTGRTIINRCFRPIDS
jgi:ATPase involved in DNA repair